VIHKSQSHLPQGNRGQIRHLIVNIVNNISQTMNFYVVQFDNVRTMFLFAIKYC
jgi:hypothetical protein